MSLVILLYIAVAVNNFSQLLKKRLTNKISCEYHHPSFLSILKKKKKKKNCRAAGALPFQPSFLFKVTFVLALFTFLQALLFPIPHSWLVSRLAFLGCRSEHLPFRCREGLETTSGLDSSAFLPADVNTKRELGKEKVAFLRPYSAAARDPPGP